MKASLLLQLPRTLCATADPGSTGRPGCFESRRSALRGPHEDELASSAGERVECLETQLRHRAPKHFADAVKVVAPGQHVRVLVGGESGHQGVGARGAELRDPTVEGRREDGPAEDHRGIRPRIGPQRVACAARAEVGDDESRPSFGEPGLERLAARIGSWGKRHQACRGGYQRPSGHEEGCQAPQAPPPPPVGGSPGVFGRPPKHVDPHGSRGEQRQRQSYAIRESHRALHRDRERGEQEDASQAE